MATYIRVFGDIMVGHVAVVASGTNVSDGALEGYVFRGRPRGNGYIQSASTRSRMDTGMINRVYFPTQSTL